MPHLGPRPQVRYPFTNRRHQRRGSNSPQGLAPSGPPSEEVKPPSGDHPVGRDAERSELKRAFCSSLSEL